MPIIPLNEVIGLEVDGNLSSGSTLPRILPEFLRLQKLALDAIPQQELRMALRFDRPLAVGAAGLKLDIGSGSGSTLDILRPDATVLDESDPFGNIVIAPDEIYLALTLELSFDTGASLGLTGWSFGFSADHALQVRCYRRFRREQGTFTSFGKALAELAADFPFPRERADLGNLDADTIWAISGTGKLTVSGAFTIGTTVEQFAANSPVADQPIRVNASSSFTTGLDFIINGGYQVRFRRLQDRSVELSLYKFDSDEMALQVSAAAGISTSTGNFELLENMIKALSPQPLIDINEFHQALPGDDSVARDLHIHDFQEQLQSAVSSKLEASVNATVSRLKMTEAVWQFEIARTSISSLQVERAVDSAFRGDFRPLTGSSENLPDGIKQTANVLTHTDLAKLSLEINLLGIVNFVSIARLARISTIEENAAGDITLLMDTADEHSLRALLLALNGDAPRLRQLLSEDFLLQASYRVSDLKVLAPEFSASHSFFETRESTGRSQLKDLLDAGRALGLLTEDEETARMQDRNEFGRTTFFIQTQYAPTVATGIFLDDAQEPRPAEYYETQGRLALGELLNGDAGQEFRKQIADMGAAGAALWRKMKKTGNVSAFNELFGIPAGTVDPRVTAAGSDYLCITSWAAAMHEAGEAIQETNQLVNRDVHVDDAGLAKARSHLKNRMADVVKHSREHFGDPLGLLMVYFASGRSAKCRMILTGDSLDRLDATSTEPKLTAQAQG